MMVSIRLPYDIPQLRALRGDHLIYDPEEDSYEVLLTVSDVRGLLLAQSLLPPPPRLSLPDHRPV